MSTLITSTWASFVRTGDPTPPGSALVWEQVGGRRGEVQVAEPERRYLTMAGGEGVMGREEEWVRRADIWREVYGEGRGL